MTWNANPQTQTPTTTTTEQPTTSGMPSMGNSDLKSKLEVSDYRTGKDLVRPRQRHGHVGNKPSLTDLQTMGDQSESETEGLHEPTTTPLEPENQDQQPQNELKEKDKEKEKDQPLALEGEGSGEQGLELAINEDPGPTDACVEWLDHPQLWLEATTQHAGKGPFRHKKRRSSALKQIDSALQHIDSAKDFDERSRLTDAVLTAITAWRGGNDGDGGDTATKIQELEAGISGERKAIMELAGIEESTARYKKDPRNLSKLGRKNLDKIERALATKYSGSGWFQRHAQPIQKAHAPVLDAEGERAQNLKDIPVAASNGVHVTAQDVLTAYTAFMKRKGVKYDPGANQADVLGGAGMADCGAAATGFVSLCKQYGLADARVGLLGAGKFLTGNIDQCPNAMAGKGSVDDRTRDYPGRRYFFSMHAVATVGGVRYCAVLGTEWKDADHVAMTANEVKDKADYRFTRAFSRFKEQDITALFDNGYAIVELDGRFNLVKIERIPKLKLKAKRKNLGEDKMDPPLVAPDVGELGDIGTQVTDED